MHSTFLPLVDQFFKFVTLLEYEEETTKIILCSFKYIIIRSLFLFSFLFSGSPFFTSSFFVLHICRKFSEKINA